MIQKESKREFVLGRYGKYGITVGVFVVVFMLATRMIPTPVVEYEPTWHVVFEASSARAENTTLAGDQSRWLSFFLLDYGSSPDTALVHNDTDWSAAGNVSGYQDTDNAAAMDIPSEDPFYFVCRAAINKTHCWDTDKFIGNRTRCHFTISGDETVTNQVVYGDNVSHTSGGGMVSANLTSMECIHINYYIDDNSDGYRITDDGTLAWNITVMAKY